MAYPCNWTPKNIAYVRALFELAGLVKKRDHPNRLLMYSEGVSVMRALQTPKFPGAVKQGYSYLVCDMGVNHVNMNLMEVKELYHNTSNDIKKTICREWDVNYAKVPSRLSIGAESQLKSLEAYLISRLSTSYKRFTLDDVYREDGALFDRRQDFHSLANQIFTDNYYVCICHKLVGDGGLF